MPKITKNDPENNKVLIEVKNLKKDFGEGEALTHALRGVDFQIHQGDFVAIMGPSGSGKSTLMHILGFLLKPSSGIYKFENKNIEKFTDDELADLRNNKAGFVFQTFNLLPRTNIFENVKLPLIYGKLKDQQKRALKVIKDVGLSHRINHTPNELSGGEQQRVAIARALVNDPQIIFADEPTGNLDSKTGLQIMKILQGLNDSGRTIILVTHETYTAQHARQILRLKDGRVSSFSKISKRRIAANGSKLK